MKINEVKYTVRLTLGQYEHEELTCSLSPDVDEKVDPAELLRQARKVCLSNSTKALKQAKEEGK